MNGIAQKSTLKSARRGLNIMPEASRINQITRRKWQKLFRNALRRIIAARRIVTLGSKAEIPRLAP